MDPAAIVVIVVATVCIFDDAGDIFAEGDEVKGRCRHCYIVIDCGTSRSPQARWIVKEKGSRMFGRSTKVASEDMKMDDRIEGDYGF